MLPTLFYSFHLPPLIRQLKLFLVASSLSFLFDLGSLSFANFVFAILAMAGMLRIVSTVIEITREWDHSLGKLMVWHMLMSLVSDLQQFRKRTDRMHLLSHNVILVKVNSGIALYTIDLMQINVNLVIPSDPTNVRQLLRDVDEYILRMHLFDRRAK